MDFLILSAIIFTFLWNPCKSVYRMSLEDVALKSEDFYEMCRSTNELLAAGLSLDQAIGQIKKDFKASLESFIWNPEQEENRGKPSGWESDRSDFEQGLTIEINEEEDPDAFETLKQLIENFLTFVVEVFFSLMIVNSSGVTVHDSNKSHTLILGKRASDQLEMVNYSFLAFPCGLLQFPERIDPYHSKENREALVEFQENLFQVHETIQLLERSSLETSELNQESKV